MQTSARRPTAPLIAMFVVLIVLGAGFAYYSFATGSALASLSSASSALSAASSSQSRQVQSLQSLSGTLTETSTQTETTTVTHSTAVSTVTSETTTTVTQTVASTESTPTVTVSKSTTVADVVTTTEGGADYQATTAILSLTAGGNGTGTLTVKVMNTGYDPITGISVSVPSGPDNTTDVCSRGCTILVQYNKSVISTSDPLPGGATACGMTSKDERVPGTSYTITIMFTYGDNSQQQQTFQVVAAQQ